MCNDNKNEENRIQYMLDENGNLAEMRRADAKPVEHSIKYRLKNAFEVFTLVDGTENYWISNYGRCVNNLNIKKPDKYYLHKEGKCHYTIFEIEHFQRKDRKGNIIEEVNRYRRETTPEDLVADAFLVSYRGRCKIWHKNGDYTDNWYKNLLYVTNDDYKRLKAGEVTWESLGYEQKYIEYENKASHEALKVYNSIKTRCGDTKDNDRIRGCYDDATMCQEWLDDPKSFVKWYLEHYYEIDGESMAVDKDLFGDGSKMYSPQTCCLLPQGINTLLANSKKHYTDKDNELPLGVRFNSKKNKYYGEIQFTGKDKAIKLSEWDAPEEAFSEYKIMKQADILLVAAHYKDKVPDYVYDKLLTVEVKPY